MKSETGSPNPIQDPAAGVREAFLQHIISALTGPIDPKHQEQVRTAFPTHRDHHQFPLFISDLSVPYLCSCGEVLRQSIASLFSAPSEVQELNPDDSRDAAAIENFKEWCSEMIAMELEQGYAVDSREARRWWILRQQAGV